MYFLKINKAIKRKYLENPFQLNEHKVPPKTSLIIKKPILLSTFSSNDIGSFWNGTKKENKKKQEQFMIYDSVFCLSKP